MLNRLVRVVLPAVVVIAFAGVALAEKSQFGTAEEAKAMLAKAVAALKADKAKALESFKKGEGEFMDRDLYPFCFNAGDGKVTAVPPKRAALLGVDVRTEKDKTGKAFGVELYNAAKGKEGDITEVSYMFPRPNETEPVQKVSFVTRVGDQGCGVGYYKK
jgi:hypothetical protein